MQLLACINFFSCSLSASAVCETTAVLASSIHRVKPGNVKRGEMNREIDMLDTQKTQSISITSHQKSQSNEKKRAARMQRV